MKLVLDAFARHCAERPDDAAIVDPDRSALTWSELAVRVAAMRALIAARTAPGARVCVSVPAGSAVWIAVLVRRIAGVIQQVAVVHQQVVVVQIPAVHSGMMIAQ